MKKRIQLLCHFLGIVVCLSSIGTGMAAAADWPTYRGDPSRRSYTAETLPAQLALCWVYHSRHAPIPAWSGRDTRMPFDRAHHAVIADGKLFFGSSADHKVYALDAATGNPQWTFFTGGPVRLPPAISKGRVFVASDDGYLYCLAAEDGRLVWKFRGGPNGSKVIGNDCIISRWPTRGGPVIQDDVVYFAAGIWPSENIYLYALNTGTGEVLWCNDDSGSIYMGQPHNGAEANSGISAQGNLVIAQDRLLVPTGRAVPAVFQRSDGKFLYFHLQKNTKFGGSEIMAVGDIFFNSGVSFVTADGRLGERKTTPVNLIAATPDGLIRWESGNIRAAIWNEDPPENEKDSAAQSKKLKEIWSSRVPFGGTSLLVAGQTIVSAGSSLDRFGVSTLDTDSKHSIWSGEVDGVPWGLAMSDQRLFVSTEKGTIYCFSADAPEKPNVVQSGIDSDPPAASEVYKNAAAEILEQTGVTEGYCLDLGAGDGDLAELLARQGKLHIDAVESDPAKVDSMRRRLDRSGFYGVRITVHEGDPSGTDFPFHYANLIISGRSATESLSAKVLKEANRCLRPYGGIACLGQPGSMKKIVRGPLAGAGMWTHQYCDAANTNCSTDSVVSGPLGMHWFTDLDFQMPSRHGRGRAPLFLDGRLFIQGLDAVLCVDAYNGRRLWKYPLPNVQKGYDGEHLMGVSGTGSNFCVTPEAVFIHHGAKCLKIDPAAGTLLSEFDAPQQPNGQPGTWGVIFNTGGTLFGTLADTQHLVTYRYLEGDMSSQYTESILLFAMDPETGKLKWQFEPENSIRNNAIAIGGGRVYLIDRPAAKGDRHREKRVGVPDAGDLHPPGKLIALDAANGRVLWTVKDDIYGTLLVLSEKYNILLMGYQDWRFKLASEIGGRMTAFNTLRGQRRWDIQGKFMTRPIVNDKTIYIQPGAWDLLTGQKKDFKFERSYGCGIPAGSKHLLVYRSATLGYTDLRTNRETENYGGIRPGCWINTLPVGGLVLMPDATDRCTCSYLIKASIALLPYGNYSPD
ncbi:MAG: PQQ-binding-like beta-propeller repeat protein [Pirellulales bacterium]|nr:PQQ-binding-like beta-propeller repeat protein [Pirellulales bacterium]